MTSHSSQGQTAGRVLVHVETERASEQLVNRRLAYVAVSRGQFDVRIYSDYKVRLAPALNREVSHRSALEHGRPTSAAQSVVRECATSGSRSASQSMAVAQS